MHGRSAKSTWFILCQPQMIKNYELRPPIISSFSKKLGTYWNISLSFTFRVCSMALSEATSETIFQKKSSCFMDMVKVTITGETRF